ncbi:MAG: pyrroline-5-carboxylate reductase [Planctomycetales bacterium]|nr:pyrroline-5-carboxylate reductase [Planctomycetales bacterium]
MRIGFIGAGQMASALAKGFTSGGRIDAAQISAADKFEQSLADFVRSVGNVATCKSNQQLVDDCDLVFLAVKPQNVVDVAASVTGIDESKLLVSIMAGVSLSTIYDRFQTKRAIRVMPNTPCLIGRGAAGFCLGENAKESDASFVRELLETVGVAVQTNESQIDTVTGLSGSGPAFVYQFIEALSDGGVRKGLTRVDATRLAAQTVLGAAAMVLETGEHPAALKDKVTSPGGTTIAGIHALENGGMRAAVMNAVEAATDRSIELGKS